MNEDTQPNENDLEPIDQYTLGGSPILNQDDVDEILEESGAWLDPAVNASVFAYWLNNAVEWTLRAQLERRLSKETVSRLNKSIQTYTEVARAFHHDEFPPPLPPVDWLAEVEGWVEAAEKGLIERQSQGAPREIETIEFLPSAIGLFVVGHGIGVEREASWMKDVGKPAVFRFLKATRKRVVTSVGQRGFSNRVHPKLAKKARWVPISDDNLRKRINVALGYRMESEMWTGYATLDAETGEAVPETVRKSDFAWRIQGDFFREMMQVSEKN
ncbi:hypothetical protein GS636_06935 [Ruegeria sp. HKCCD4884]|uniref:hypothetical protein n=1 Tax=Ruegeria sp. HKCCD4884 TaxID=2683022 RepID=UPI001491CA34|nr:hypothetical protein [Ruegeria sp. HKCCD4884]NOD92516.1 hypothetical protein [Ruegeria sp. HKCCD4884]